MNTVVVVVKTMYALETKVVSMDAHKGFFTGLMVWYHAASFVQREVKHARVMMTDVRVVRMVMSERSVNISAHKIIAIALNAPAMIKKHLSV